MNQTKTTSNTASPFLGVGLYALFVALGTYLYFVKASEPLAENPHMLRLTGASCIAFFGLLLLMCLIKAFRRA
ncbi:hypothetical protein ACLI09_07535 [Flavobacterium sp. RHBU_24]|uniref:hypothetical protein n=1 Tax=Flavobacterium sp. RHBU_24 TaxID=3391185 RepID=UPI0039848C63